MWHAFQTKGTLAVSVTLPGTVSRMTFSHACSTSNRQIGHFINRGTLFQNYQGNSQSPAQIVYQNVNADQEDPNGQYGKTPADVVAANQKNQSR